MFCLYGSMYRITHWNEAEPLRAAVSKKASVPPQKPSTVSSSSLTAGGSWMPPYCVLECCWAWSSEGLGWAATASAVHGWSHSACLVSLNRWLLHFCPFFRDGSWLQEQVWYRCPTLERTLHSYIFDRNFFDEAPKVQTMKAKNKQMV